jgi:hypothetical protein
VPPRDAAIWRLKRGSPPFGWHPLTQTGQPSPEWSAPDPEALVDEVRKLMLPEIAPLYDGSVPEHEQWKISSVRVVDPPQQGTKQSQLPAKADAKPWATLVIPAVSDPFLNLATGFGTAYSLERIADGQIGVGNSDFLVTAGYRDVLPRGTGGAEFAAYAPQGTQHTQTPAPAPLTATRSGLVAPVEPDLAWRETVRLGWKLPQTSAGMGVPTQTAHLRFDPAGGNVEPLIEKRDPSGWRPLAISPDAPKGQPGNDRTSLVDGAAEIPIGSGGRTVGYSAAVSDIYGVWSSWRDALYTGDEPGPEAPRIISLALDTVFAGSTSCPGTLRMEVASEWLQRRPSGIDLVAVFFPMALPTTPPPAGLDPESPTVPAGCFRRAFGIQFDGDQPDGVGCAVDALNTDGTAPETPGPAQGNGGRRYRVRTDLTLDFGGTRRWGVQLWARRELFVGSSPSGWAPVPTSPALTSAASPVPVPPILPPQLDDVPLASLPDAGGHSHARVAWTLPAGAPVRRTAIWECAETAMRQSLGIVPSQAPDTDTPSSRLDAIRSAYNGVPLDQRRLLFRRLTEVPGATRSYDAVLPKGSTDIHFFTVTPITDTGVEAPWPSAPAKNSLQAFIAPRLRRPAPPLVRSRPGAAGGIVLDLASASGIPVARFRLLRTRSEQAARRADTMGPAFAEVSATVAAGPPDPVTGQPVYTASWSGAFPESWDEWHVRAIAIPQNTMPVQAVRGLPSDPSDVVRVTALPSAAPDLAPLVIETDAAHTGIVVRTSTSAPARTVPTGDHRVAATAGETEVAPALLQSLPETPLMTPPPASATQPVLERGARAAGRTPLALFFTRPVAADPVEVAVRVTDPLGRVSERTETVPGWVPPPPVDLTLVDAFVIAGRGVAVVVTSDAPVEVDPPYTLAVTARRLIPPFPPPPRMVGSRKLPDIEPTGTPTPLVGIQFGWQPDPDGVGRQYDVWIPIRPPMQARITMIAPDGGQVSVSVEK